MYIPERTIDSLFAAEVVRDDPYSLIWSPTQYAGSPDHELTDASGRVGRTRSKRARRTPASAEEHRYRSEPAEPRKRISIAKLYAKLDHLKLQVRYMAAPTKQKLCLAIRAELEQHRQQAQSYVRPDDSLELKAREVLAVLGDEQALASRARTPAPAD
ncbi:MAG: hypothetical protein ACTMKY_13220, partial [Dermabacteraceae bacterium]